MYESQHNVSINLVDIGDVIITPTSPILAINGMDLTLRSLADITPNPLPQNVSSPYFEWFFSNTSLPPDVTVSHVINSGNSYISTLQFSPLQLNHTGTYRCRLGGNERLAANVVVIANGTISLVFD